MFHPVQILSVAAEVRRQRCCSEGWRACFAAQTFHGDESSGLEPTNLDCVPVLDTSIDPLAFPLGPSNRSPGLGSICSEDNLRRIVRPWTEEDIAQLKRLQALGASPARASVALKRSRLHVMERARALGVPFMTMRERRKRQAGREAAERIAAGLPPEQRR
jgi:hypothetical protein